MSDETVLGQFTLEHRTIEVSGNGGTTVWLRRTEPEPAMDLGCVVEIDSDVPRLRLYRAEWSPELRAEAKTRAVALWRRHAE